MWTSVSEEMGSCQLAVAHVDSKITRLVLGIKKPNFEFQKYKDFNDLYIIIVKKIETL
jgi:hypothetical protein